MKLKLCFHQKSILKLNVSQEYKFYEIGVKEKVGKQSSIFCFIFYWNVNITDTMTKL